MERVQSSGQTGFSFCEDARQDNIRIPGCVYVRILLSQHMYQGSLGIKLQFSHDLQTGWLMINVTNCCKLERSFTPLTDDKEKYGQ